MLKKKIFFFLILIFSYNSYCYANNSIAYMDFNYVINNSLIGKKMLSNLNNLNKKNIENLKSKQKELRIELDEINKIKNIASKEDIQKKISTHNTKLKEYENLKKKLANDLNKKKNDEMNKLIELINPILEKYLKENSIEILLNKEIVYFAKDKYDISEKIISLTNKKYK